jgi:hypothetical protein
VCILTEPTRSRWKRPPQFRQTQVLPLGLCLCWHRGHRLLVPRSGQREHSPARLRGFMGEVVDVFPVFPLRHAAVVVPATAPITDAVRIADEERADLVLDAEVDDGCRVALCCRVAHAPLGPATHLVFRPLQLLPTERVLLAPALLSGELSELSASLPLEGADAAPGDDERRALAGGHGGQVDLPEVNGCLGGPLDRVERFGAPGVRACQLGMLPGQFACGLNGSEEGAEDGLHRLAV